ncbi:hypothetical protein CVT25_010593 [Psilocybe cyanescens]|uniref:Uncharacterized protein n=1 Tax=Psilocybe cyanescens TaxID=93625 RepID=A0A409WJG4_PSICY|nr:hypothetical protein CVT25_010593 [Psilocybe cyanescens]
MSTVVTVVEELYLLNRCRRLFQSTFILAALFVMVLAHAILEFYSGVYVVAFPRIEPDARRYGNQAASILASIASTVDFFIPLALICQIHAVTPLQISRQRSWRDTVVNTISSGGCGAVMNIVLVVLFWTRADIFYILVNTMGRVYIITIFVNLIVSKSRSSPYDVPDVTKKRNKLSFSANLKLYNFSKPAASRISPHMLDKKLPPTPEEARFNRHLDIEADQSSPSLSPHIEV